jgi:hypothetical protein
MLIIEHHLKFYTKIESLIPNQLKLESCNFGVSKYISTAQLDDFFFLQFNMFSD